MQYINGILCLGLMIFTLGGCNEERLPPGTVGEVNGRYIYLRSLDAMRDARESVASGSEMPDVEQIQEEYSRLLATYILYLLVDEELTRLGYTVPDAEVEAQEAAIRESYPPGEYEAAIKENALDMDEWRRLVRYQRGVEIFCDTVLRPHVQISEADVQAWFAQHGDAASVPEQALVRLLYTAGEDNDGEPLRKLCRDGKALTPPAALPAGVRVLHSAIFGMDTFMSKKDKYFKEKKKGACGAVLPLDDGWSVAVLEDVLPARTLKPEEMYTVCLEALEAEQVNAALLRWVEKQLKTVRVRVSGHLQGGFAEILRQSVEGPRMPELVGPVFPMSVSGEEGTAVPEAQTVPPAHDAMPAPTQEPQPAPAPAMQETAPETRAVPRDNSDDTSGDSSDSNVTGAAVPAPSVGSTPSRLPETVPREGQTTGQTGGQTDGASSVPPAPSAPTPDAAPDHN